MLARLQRRPPPSSVAPVDSLQQQLQHSLGTTYALERELGGGGMSRVFVAAETALGRRVVVKLLAPQLAEGISVERFAREIRLAASLQQANIVRVLSAGDARGAEQSYDRFLARGDFNNSGDAQFVAGAYKRAGELAEARGDVAKAIVNYQKFVDLWSDADPELQPSVREVRARLARLHAQEARSR
jgi:hypothetical protein